MRLAARLLYRTLELVSVALLVVLAAVVVVAVFARYVLNDSLPWYDEVASVLLAWITYFGAALAAQKRAHMGFGAFVTGLPPPARYALFVVAEIIVYTVFVALAWAGWRVLAVMEGMTLESLPVPLAVVQGIVPVGCALICLAQIASTPLALERLRAGSDADAAEIAAELERSAEERRRAETEAAAAAPAATYAATDPNGAARRGPAEVDRRGDGGDRPAADRR